MNIKKHFSNHIFFYSIVLCLVITIIASFYRFIIKNDYLVYYESPCDPNTKSCFESCDDNCTYYMKVQKYAPDVFVQCGKDITDCKSASVCLPSDRKCSITYCNPKIDENCDKITNVVPSDEQNNINKPI